MHAALAAAAHSVENQEIYSRNKINRQIDHSVVTHLVKSLLSRIFCQKIVRVIMPQCGKMRNSLSPKKYFVKSTL